MHEKKIYTLQNGTNLQGSNTIDFQLAGNIAKNVQMTILQKEALHKFILAPQAEGVGCAERAR